MWYDNKQIITKPIIVKETDIDDINKTIQKAISYYVFKYVKIGQETKINMNINPCLIDVTIDDLREWYGNNEIRIINGLMFSDTEKAMEYFSKTFKKLIVYLDEENENVNRGI